MNHFDFLIFVLIKDDKILMVFIKIVYLSTNNYFRVRYTFSCEVEVIPVLLRLDLACLTWQLVYINFLYLEPAGMHGYANNT